MKNFKPMLAGKAIDFDSYPVMASPKLDGVRCLLIKGKALSRSLKEIPNKHVQKILKNLPDGLDGELGVGYPGDKDFYRNTVSAVMREEGEPNFTFWVFDNFALPLDTPYAKRYESLGKLHAKLNWVDNPHVKVLPHTIIKNAETLLDYEQEQLTLGFEGVILRSTNGPYKCGRSSTKEGYLLKVKRYSDSEAEILNIQELLHNDNEATTNELGRTARSSHKDNMTPMGTMGALNVRDVKSGVEFSIGTGFDQELRQKIWNSRKKMIGKLVKYKFFDGGSKVAPRFPVFLGFRDKRDM